MSFVFVDRYQSIPVRVWRDVCIESRGGGGGVYTQVAPAQTCPKNGEEEEQEEQEEEFI